MRRCCGPTTLACLIVVTLIGAAVPAVTARLGLPSPGRRAVNVINDFDADAAVRGWPISALRDWPSPTQWQDDRAFAYRQILVFSGPSPGETSHQLQAERLGWPWFVVERNRMWWPETDDPPPGFVGARGWTIVWPRLLTAMLLCGAVALTAVGVPLLGGRALIRTFRVRQHRCAQCGYPVGRALMCTECGAPVA